MPDVSEVLRDSCELTWRPPEIDGGTPITGYHIERSTGKGRLARWIRITRHPVEDTYYKVTDLIEDNDYQFRIVAENKVGTGEPGPASEPITAKDPWSKESFLNINEYT